MSELIQPLPTALSGLERRPPPEGNAVDALLARAYGSLRARAASPASLARLADQVLAQAAALDAADAAALASERDALRLALRRNGHEQALVLRALALVCVTAQRELGLSPHPVQCMGALALLRGMVVEMATGEGKSLTAALAAAAFALGGRPVHVITVNEYLAERDAAVHRPLFAALGLSVAAALPGQAPAERAAVYAQDIAYCTNKDVVFDFLRDRLGADSSRSPREQAVQQALAGGGRASLLGELAFAIVDEADSVLIDEARTPLIIASERDRVPAEVCAEALEIAKALEVDQHYRIDRLHRQVLISESGAARIAELAAGYHGLWRGERARLHLVRQALSAGALFVRERDYILRDGKVQIVDEFTGRVLPDRAWENGIHQMVEVKEGLPMTPSREPVARLTYPAFFTRYARLAGMTGTGREVAGELLALYGLKLVCIPTHRPVRRQLLPPRLFVDGEQQGSALLTRCSELARAGRAVLVGTRSVEASERIAALLQAGGLQPVVLNAKQDADEAGVVAQAGQPGRITVATNMAGRGTDIGLDETVRERGGLHVILTEAHESARIDRQLFGRAARQGDPGSCEALLALDAELFQRYLPGLARRAARFADGRGLLPPWLAAPLRWLAQARAERVNAYTRAQSLRHERQQGRWMAFAGKEV